jgi:wobble nucleotide-excising tRNase
MRRVEINRMIKKLLEIKNLGIFHSYRWDNVMPDFVRFNLIYGWNGSGKTTLSELFTSFENGKLDEYPDLKYKIETSDGEYTEKSPYRINIRVFNQRYISQNIDVLSCKANPIYILGEENKKLAEIIRKDEAILKGDPETGNLGKLTELDITSKELTQKEKEKDDHFSSVAKTISTTLTGVVARDYRRGNAASDFEFLTSKDLLNQSEIDNYSATLNQQELIVLEEIHLDLSEEKVDKLLIDAKALLEYTVEVHMINRLNENPHISHWVEEGLNLHNQEKSKTCEFCNQPLPEDRIKALVGYFNDADKRLKEDVDALLIRIEEIREIILNINPIDKANLYTEFQADYLKIVGEFEEAKKVLFQDINGFKKVIEAKKGQTTKSLSLNSSFSLNEFINLVRGINIYINSHNNKSHTFTQSIVEAQQKLKVHYLSEIYDDVKSMEAGITRLRTEIDILQNGNPNDPDEIGILQIQARIDENKNKISVSGLACDEINKQLETFLGRRELVFEDTEDGYIIKRGGEIAKNLSEGEKTAIAFVYFIIHLKDRDFDLRNDIVIIDDPVSSLDSNSLFQAFSFLKNAVQDCAQVFIFTHHFDFLQLIINWFEQISNRQGSKKYYMIKNIICEGKRIAKLDTLDKLLISYNSEYQYLFKTLLDFSPDGTIGSVYPIPNIARKVLDNFLMIMVPDNSSPYQKLEQIDFDKNKKTAIYKFTNDQSHITGKGFDPSLISESQNVVNYLLEMMNAVFPSHYSVLENSVRNSEMPNNA